MTENDGPTTVVPTRFQLDEVLETTRTCLGALFEVMAVGRLADPELRAGSEGSLTHVLDQLSEECELAADPKFARTLRWLADLCPRALSVGPNLTCSTHHHAVIRLSRNVLHAWQEVHNASGAVPDQIDNFFIRLDDRQLTQTKKSLYDFLGNLRVEAVVARRALAANRSSVQIRVLDTEWQVLDVINKHDRGLARQANRLLDCWREVPGLVIGQTDATNGAGNDLTAKQKENVVPPDVNGDQLLAWITKARELSQVAARLKVCDGRIGNVLAFSPPDADGLWPCTSVRDVLEKIRSVELDRGIVIGVHNKRGVFGATGGDAERALSARYRAYADREQAAWPHVAAICSEIADDYARHADQEAKASELDEFA